MSTLSRPKGTQDWVAERARDLNFVERTVADVFERYSYQPIRLPMMENVELFQRGVGEATDIVEKEMFLLESRGGEDRSTLALRPEGTASTVRALEQEGLLFNQQQRVYYAGSMFRYEQPQKGRYREFYQIGAEAFGFAGPDLDAELLLMIRDSWRALGIEEFVTLELNTIGSAEDRAQFGAALKAYLEPYRSDLDGDSQRRLDRNPLRILDSKVPRTREILADAPRLETYVNADAQAHFDGLIALLEGLGLSYRRNASLVRGLDYYNNTVFEWVTEQLGAQSAVCAGGRYDALVARLGGKATPAAGFGLGLDRAVLLREHAASGNLHLKGPGAAVDVYLCIPKAANQLWAAQLAAELREALPTLKLRLHQGGGKLDKQLKRADQSGAALALITGPEEIQADAVMFKPLRGNGDARVVPRQDLATAVTTLLERG